MQDVGSGAIADLSRLGGAGHLREPTVAHSLLHCDLVAFSADKLLGGPQAGLVVGTEAAIAPLRRHPLMRAVRLDKVTLAALDATLRLYRDPARAAERVPVLRMLSQTAAMLDERAGQLRALLAGIPGARAHIQPSKAETGGGTLPGETIPSRAVALALAATSPDALARALRLGRPAIVGRIADGTFLLDVFAVSDAELPAIAAAVAALAATQ
jgi:L-seryl-tRNA(Ser) seleniumtransferase